MAEEIEQDNNIDIDEEIEESINNRRLLEEVRDLLQHLVKNSDARLRLARIQEDRLSSHAIRDSRGRALPVVMLICQTVGVVFTVLATIAGVVSTAIVVKKNFVRGKEGPVYAGIAISCDVGVMVLAFLLWLLRWRRHTNRFCP